jgi:hypothetical protein
MATGKRALIFLVTNLKLSAISFRYKKMAHFSPVPAGSSCLPMEEFHFVLDPQPDPGLVDGATERQWDIQWPDAIGAQIEELDPNAIAMT